VVGHQNVEPGEVEDLAGGDASLSAVVLVDRAEPVGLNRLDQRIILFREESSVPRTGGNITLVKGLSNLEQGFHDGVSLGRQGGGTEVGIRDDNTVGLGNKAGLGGTLHDLLEDVAVEGIGEGATQLIGVDPSSLIVGHSLLNVSDEGAGEQKSINGDGPLI